MRRRTFLKTSAAIACNTAWSWQNKTTESTTLRSEGMARNVLVGSAVSNKELHTPGFAQILREQYSIVVPQNEMKWSRTHPEQDRYDFKAADELVAFAEQHSIKVRGHNLCWHEAVPVWLEKVATQENAARLLREHITTVAGHFAGKIHSWDVVNEAIEVGDGRPDGLRNTLWMQLLGERYLAIAFHAAQQADPRALLTYNDYGLEGDSDYHEKRRTVALALLKWFRKNSIPIQALGLQSHLKGRAERTDYSRLQDFLKEVAALDLQIFVTELDVQDDELPGNAKQRAKKAAEGCKEYLEAVLKNSRVTALLTWGMASYQKKRDGKIVGHIALPYDEHLRSSPFLGAIEDALQKR